MDFDLFNTWVIGEMAIDDNDYDSVSLKNFRLKDNTEVSFLVRRDMMLTTLIIKNPLDIEKDLINSFVREGEIYRKNNKENYVTMVLIVGKIYSHIADWLMEELKSDSVIAAIGFLEQNDINNFDMSVVSRFIRRLHDIGFYKKDVEDIIKTFSDDLYDCALSNSITKLERNEFDKKVKKILNNVYRNDIDESQ